MKRVPGIGTAPEHGNGNGTRSAPGRPDAGGS
jgi:hypothetical protein